MRAEYEYKGTLRSTAIWYEKREDDSTGPPIRFMVRERDPCPNSKPYNLTLELESIDPLRDVARYRVLEGGVILWTVYDHPRDYPNTFVARKFVLDQPTSEFIVSPDLESLREILWQRGLTRLMREPGDDPVIVETWL